MLLYLPEQQADQSQQYDPSQDRHHDNPQGGTGVQLLPHIWINVDLDLHRADTVMNTAASRGR